LVERVVQVPACDFQRLFRCFESPSELEEDGDGDCDEHPDERNEDPTGWFCHDDSPS
jgi:hypothetical protein